MVRRRSYAGADRDFLLLSVAGRRSGCGIGAMLFELVDDEQLVEKLKELKLGLKTEMVEKVTVHKSGFTNI
jgi:hypothetical protein